MSGPQRGAVMGGLIYEGLAKDLAEAEALVASGAIKFDPCNMHSAVGPMAGVVTYSMPVWILENKAFGNRAYCTINEGLGKVLRFGACDEEVLTRLRWMEKELYPVLKEAMAIKKEIDVKVLVAKLLQMGDEGHNRNEAGTSLLIRELVPAILACSKPQEQKVAAYNFINGNNHTFLNISMPAMKCTLDPIFDIPYCTVVATMAARTDSASALGAWQGCGLPARRRWSKACISPGTTKKTPAGHGDSCFTETGASEESARRLPGHRSVRGRAVSDAVKLLHAVYESTVGEGRRIRFGAELPRRADGDRHLKGAGDRHPPVINTGIAQKPRRRPGGAGSCIRRKQLYAGLRRAPNLGG
jgi:hypothetical protein